MMEEHIVPEPVEGPCDVPCKALVRTPISAMRFKATRSTMSLLSQVGGIRPTTADPMLNDAFCSSHSPPFLRSGGI